MADGKTWEPTEVISLPTVLPPPQQLEVRRPGEDWTGLADSAQRRKLQNRLHQRAWRRRNAWKRRNLGTSSAPQTDANRTRVSQHRLEGFDAWNSFNPAGPLPISICDADATSVQQMLIDFEKYAYQEYLLGSPRVDLLLTLVKFNVFRALMSNNFALGFTLDWLHGDAISPFQKRLTLLHGRPHSAPTRPTRCPSHLRPTLLQQVVEHHPWIDLFPVPEMRDNILRAGAAYDDAPLCRDLVDICGNPGERSGLLVWGDPWDPRNWEVGEEFLKKWPWVIEGCWELFSATNYWRTRRGEGKLFPDAMCKPPIPTRNF